MLLSTTHSLNLPYYILISSMQNAERRIIMEEKTINNTIEYGPHDFFDRVFKRVMTLSSPTIVKFINGIFDTDYPSDSSVSYNLTEGVTDELKKTLADTILTINGIDSYHLEAQMYKDENILIRVFDYGYIHSKRKPEDIFDENNTICGIRLTFPRQVVIYLNKADNIPNEYIIEQVVNDGKIFKFSIPVIKFQTVGKEDIIKKHMIILLPFKLLRVRDKFKRICKDMKDDIDHEELQKAVNELREIYQDDIIKTIETGYENGDISREDKNRLIELTIRLMNHLYSKYSNYKEVDDMFYDHSLILDVDKYIDKVEDLENQLAEKDNSLIEKENALAKKDSELAEKDKQIIMLQEKLSKYES